MMGYVHAAVTAAIAVAGILAWFDSWPESKAQRKYLKEIKRNART